MVFPLAAARCEGKRGQDLIIFAGLRPGLEELDRVDRLNEGKFTSISFFPAAAGLSRCMRASVTWGRNGLASFWPKAPDGTGRLAVAGGRA